MKRSLAAAGAALTIVAALPLAASAHHKPTHPHGPPAWAGTPGGPHGAGQANPPGQQTVAPSITETETTPALTEALPPAPGKAPPAGRCKKAQRVGFTVLGTFGSYEEPSLTVEVTETNRHARDYLASNDPVFDLTGARITFDGVTDADASETVGFEDALATDAVEIGGKIIRPKRGCDAERSLRIARVTVTRPTVEPEPGIEPAP